MPDQISSRSAAPVVILAAILIGFSLVLLWHWKHGAIVQGVLLWKNYELAPIVELSNTAKQLQVRLMLYFRYAPQVTFKEMLLLGWQIGLFYVFIPLSFSVGAAYRALRHPILRAGRVHTMQSLLEVQSQHFSAVAPILMRDLTDDTSPEWASSLHPEEWVAQQGLVVNHQLDIARVRGLLIEQLGTRIHSFEQLKPHEQALFAIFGLRVFFKDTKGAQALIDALNYSAVNFQSRPDFTLAQADFKRCAAAKSASKWLLKHPYVRTLLMALLIESRQMGVLPSSHFIWLKPLDRALWYPLNTAGRKVPFMEAAAVFNQMQAEIVAWDNRCSLTEPHVEEAIQGLQRYLEEVGILDTSNAI